MQAVSDAKEETDEMIVPGEIFSYAEMFSAEQTSLQQGMNFRPGGRDSIILVSARKGAPYADRIEDGGRVLVYKSHNLPRTAGGPDQIRTDRTETRPSGALTSDGKFARAAREFCDGSRQAERIHVFEELRDNIWVFNGIFELVD